MKRLITLATILFGLSASAFAGDVATLVNLGFSPDSAYFMFGYYGLDMAAGKPYAEIYIVDTKKNEFTSDGVYRGLYPVELQPGWNPAGAFYRLFATTITQAGKRKIDHLEQGRLIYLSINGEDASDVLSFKDFSTKVQWDVSLKENVTEEKDGSILSSFGLDVSILGPDGKKISLKAGNPQIRRKNVKDYTIRQILVAPDGKTVVVLIERLEKDPTGSGIRYMVETFRLP